MEKAKLERIWESVGGCDVGANRNGDDVTDINRIYLVGFFPNDLFWITSSWRLDTWNLVIRLCCGLLDEYKDLQRKKLRYLAVAVDSEEALQTLRIMKLLQWLSAIGVKHVSLYDMEGVLKKNKETILKSLSNSRLWEVVEART
ncbi:dehydrodolichyl diphosphate synthase complex subunit NUS1 [Cinnamomum micranthum f. kanehirae]|uniref:ditrans,polycis-polyprenyl diphosphate synthase [(2E,6E)-farnesyldiphosphate specific] n=1 Tax=Cinnamomum micranthum f. kanehirae TaxID=337451 RepID=A0A3S3PAL3_9MAGN|nr:dehydrodolichyl diphosphate synthase complex subunit NUS1 [Cinnamomum micranthum f. kanehirae]